MAHDGTSATNAPDRERSFALDELFISITDAKGKIRLGNDVFVRVSGYSESELVGRAHNIVRHPDMPRAVFSLMWDELGAGRTFAGYVKNQAADGSYYWVMAVVAPVPGGYVSVRLKPTTPLLAAARSIYAELLQVERDVEQGEPRRRKAAIAASRARLGELLEHNGFATYDEFAHAALPAEVRARADALGDAATPRPGCAADDLLAACAGARGSLATLAGDLGELTRVAGGLAGRAQLVADLAEDIRMDSINGLLAAARLTDGVALATIADLMSVSARSTGAMIEQLSAGMSETVLDVRAMAFRMAAADLQIEMMLAFLGAQAPESESQVFLPLLAGAGTAAVDHVCATLPGLEAQLKALAVLAKSLRRELAAARTLVVNGRIEVARSGQVGHAEHFFTAIGERVSRSERELAGFAQVESMRGLSESVALRARDDADHLRSAVQSVVGAR